MPPRIDPYANKTHRRIDIALIVITLLMMFFAFRVFAHDRALENNRSDNNNVPAAAQSNH